MIKRSQQEGAPGAAGGVERRAAIRVPVRGTAVVAAARGSVDNLSSSGVLISVPTPGPATSQVELELHLDDAVGRVQGRPVRVRRDSAGGVRMAVAFDRVDAAMATLIDGAIASALRASRQRPVLVIDDQPDRRARVVARLARCGMTPVTPRTPLEAVDALARTRLHVEVCLLAPGFGVPRAALASALADSFPWVTTAEITDDIEHTVDRAILAWSQTPLGVTLGAA